MESFFLLWKTTGDVKWRERGWAVFQALEKHARVQNGYASVHDVDEVPAVPNDDMPRCVPSKLDPPLPNVSLTCSLILTLLTFSSQLFPS